MYRLYDDFLDRHAPHSCGPADILQGVYDGLLPKASGMGIQLANIVESSIEERDIQWLALNHVHVNQVLTNLVLNALKATCEALAPAVTISMSASIEEPAQLEAQAQDFTLSDHAQFNARAWHVCAKVRALDPQSPIYLRFTVQDNGKGLSQGEMTHLFKRFKATDRHTYGPGTGLGLPVSKQLVELQGGKISVTSREGVGSTFAFYIRTYRTPEPEDLTRATIARAVEMAVRDFCANDRTLIESRFPPISPQLDSILIVEDNVINQRILSIQLKKYRYVVHIANDGEEALNLLARYNTKKGKGRDGTQIALVLLDDYVSPIY
jgi:Histidine kinase-, DNA gyrase B-, and HSP90-like ATPase